LNKNKEKLNKNWSRSKFLSSLNKDAKELFEIWLNSNGYSVKMTSYFSTYAELLSKFRKKKCTLVEIGVLDGGSLFMWRKWLGNDARIIGIDLNPKAKLLEKYGFEIFVGNQADASFWKKFYAKVSKIDILIDDGGHQSFQQIMSVYSAICNLNSECLVIVEDTATSFYTHMSSFHKKNSFLEFAKDSTDILTVKEREMRPQRWPKFINENILTAFKNVQSIQFFSGIVSFTVNPHNIEPSIAVNNRLKTEYKDDYRKSGEIKGIEIEWPSPFRKEIVKIEGENLVDTTRYSKIKFK
tara:strand:+ start:24 stop:914 length:891 start_codon:yes stop_codon:yes gene_type:complete